VKGLEDVDSASVEDDLTQKLPHASWAKHLFISAKTAKGCSRILPTAISAYEAFNRRVPTARLNRFLETVTTAYTPPQRYHHPVRLYYMAQIRVRPPTFVVFSNSPEGVGASYQRYLVGRLREEFGIWGSPVKLLFRKRRSLGQEKEA
jgi:GTP-binding protein